MTLTHSTKRYLLGAIAGFTLCPGPVVAEPGGLADEVNTSTISSPKDAEWPSYGRD